MICFYCPHYESSGMSTGEAWNRCGITEAEYFCTEDTNCPYVDENGNDNGKFDELIENTRKAMGNLMKEKSNIPFADLDRHCVPRRSEGYSD